MRATQSKISEIFGRAVVASGIVFHVIYLSLAVCAAARGAPRFRMENKIFVDWSYFLSDYLLGGTYKAGTEI